MESKKKFSMMTGGFISLLCATVLTLTGCDPDKDPKVEPQLSAAGAVSFDAAGGEKTFAVTANIAWTVTGHETVTWLNITPSAGNGSGNETVTATATANTSTTARSAELTINAVGVTSVKVTVTQAGAAETPPAKIDLAAIGGVTPPAAGETPVTAITETAQYTGSVSWEPAAATFANSTAYTATITLTPKTGYTLTGVAANFFTVAGATSVANPANSGVVTAQFPATATPALSITDPENLTVDEGQEASFKVVASGGSTPYKYQWQISTNGGGTWNNLGNVAGSIEGATADELKLLNVAAALNGASGRCMVTDANNVSVTSGRAILTVIAPDGSAEKPFIVNSVATLKKVGTGTDGWERDKHYRQTANITFSATETWDYLSFPLAGVYDGGGYSINNLSGGYSLFSNIDVGGTVRNVALRNVKINAKYRPIGYTGGIAQDNEGTIENCYVTGQITTTDIDFGQTGGIAGLNRGVIKNCYTTCDVESERTNAGGITGSNEGTVAVCYATGKIKSRNDSGGIVGHNASSGKSERCVALNREVIGHNLSTGRIAGYSDSGTLTANFARAAGMTLKDGGGVVITLSPADKTLTSKHGADIGAAFTHGANSVEFWSAGCDDNLWDLAPNRLPHLKTTTGATFSEPQNPTVQ